jgi:hypothetical protein
MSNYKKITESILNGKIQEVEMPTPHLNKRRLSLDEVKQMVAEEFEKAKAVCDIKAKEVEDGWGKTELEKEINWMKALSLKEFFIKETK